jgi:protoheme IX farnesyltransferase
MVRLKGYARLLRLRIVALLLFTALVAAAVAGGGSLRAEKILFLVLAGGVASIGSGFLNHYFDRDMDAVMSRTRGRPIPSGEVSSDRVLYLGLALLGLSMVLSYRLNLLASIFILSGALVYVVVYTLWLKRRTSLNIVVGGLSGAFAALAGWAAVNPELSLTPILIAFVLFLWTPSHFWCFAILHREGYRRAGVPMLPVVVGCRRASGYILANTVLLFLASLLLYSREAFGMYYLLAALIAGGAFIFLNLRQVTAPSTRLAWRNYKFSGAYLLILLSAMLFDVYV